jgi:hypothetical protein
MANQTGDGIMPEDIAYPKDEQEPGDARIPKLVERLAIEQDKVDKAHNAYIDQVRASSEIQARAIAVIQTIYQDLHQQGKLYPNVIHGALSVMLWDDIVSIHYDVTKIKQWLPDKSTPEIG